MRGVIRERLMEVEVQRVERGLNERGGETQTTTTHTQHIWLYRPDEANIQNEFGMQLNGDLSGLAIPTQYDPPTDFDVEHGDRIEHGGITYEVEAIRTYPDPRDPDIIGIQFDRRQ